MRKLQFGAYAPPAPHLGMSAFRNLESKLETRLQVVHFYQAWGGGHAEFRADWIAAAAKGDRSVLLTWEPWIPGGPVEQSTFSLEQILHGRYDKYVKEWASGIAVYGEPVYLRPMHEMNGNHYPWSGGVNGNSPSSYRQAWRHLHAIFQQVAAHNARWIWCPLVDDIPITNNFEQFYPGDEYVDVLALDGYNWGSSHPGHGGWRSFEAVFKRSYERIVSLDNKPIWIAEVASATQGGDKALWVEEMFRVLADSFHELNTLVWFHAVKERDWRATSPPRVRRVFASKLSELLTRSPSDVKLDVKDQSDVD